MALPRLPVGEQFTISLPAPRRRAHGLPRATPRPGASPLQAFSAPLSCAPRPRRRSAPSAGGGRGGELQRVTPHPRIGAAHCDRGAGGSASGRARHGDHGTAAPCCSRPAPALSYGAGQAGPHSRATELLRRARGGPDAQTASPFAQPRQRGKSSCRSWPAALRLFARCSRPLLRLKARHVDEPDTSRRSGPAATASVDAAGTASPNVVQDEVHSR